MWEWPSQQTMDLSNQSLHFIGIGGTGMSAIARYTAECGATVSGSDPAPGPATETLARLGMQVTDRQDGRLLHQKLNVVVASPAIKDDNPELARAQRMGLEVIRYPELLGYLMSRKKGIAISGTHGKSTTSSIAAFIMRRAGLDPSYVIGADVPQLGGGSHYGRGEYLVAEACEYQRSFLYLDPKLGVITNIDVDHLDYFYDLGEIKEAFCEFTEAVTEKGSLIVNADDKNTMEVVRRVGCDAITYGIGSRAKADYRAERLWRAKVHTNFDLTHNGKAVGRFTTQLYGTHNVQNALAAIAACHNAGMSFDDINAGLAEFEGAARRMQLVGTPWNVAVISDYAHHPREIVASISATKQRFPKRRIFVIFQPHQYSRTKKMLPELAEALDDVWVTYICDIYAARDSKADRRAVSAQDLVRQMNHTGRLAHYVPEFRDIKHIITGDVIPDDVVLVMGAGSIWQVAHDIVPMIAAKGERSVAA